LWIAVESLAAYWAETQPEDAGVLLGYLDAQGRRSVNLTRRHARAAARVAQVPAAQNLRRRGAALDRDALLDFIDANLANDTKRGPP
jgi:hypothetical protein